MEPECPHNHVIELLRAVLPSIIDITRFFFLGTDPRASAAKQWVRQRSTRGSQKPFHVTFYAELKLLFDVASTFTEPRQQLRGAIFEETRLFLEGLEEDFVDLPASEGAAHSSIGVCCPGLSVVASLYEGAERIADDAQRLEWLLQRTLFGRPKRGAQKRIVEGARRSREAFQGLESCHTGDAIHESSEDIKRIDGTLRFDVACRRLEHMHSCCIVDWSCTCEPSHLDAKITIELSEDDETDDEEAHQTLSFFMVYPSKKSSLGWRSASLRIRKQRKIKIGHPCLHGALCRDLETPIDESRRDSVQGVDNGRSINSRGVCEPPVTLDKVTALDISERERLLLALYISHLYLRLSGGPWWPYHRIEHGVFFQEPLSPHDWNFTLPLLSVPDRSNDEKAPLYIRLLNQEMPSLPALGKTILQILTGRIIDWPGLDDALKAYQRKPFADEITQVVNALLSEQDDVFKGKGGMRGNERMRIAFETRVIKPLQHILKTGFKLNLDEILKQAIAISKKIPRAAQEPTTSANSRHESAYEQNHPAGLCLHDNGDEDVLENRNAASASSWMTKLEGSVKQCELTEETDHGRVRIAIIDTGANIDDVTLEERFNSRLKECRSWLNGSDGVDGILLHPIVDEDGHGTHNASIALKATQHTQSEVYVAQVFRRRRDKQTVGTTMPTQLAIAHAIRYATEVWHVDVISMSFGYDLSIPDIDRELRNASDRGVVMFAAASNVGGNSSISWPARNNNVIPVYATDGFGNKYHRNPSPDESRHNFAILGAAIEGCWLPNTIGATQSKHRSGTSSATALAAGVAGVIISLMHKKREIFIARRNVDFREREEVLYDNCLRVLHTPGGMKAVFQLMSEEKRDGYDYVTPWSVLEQRDTWDAVNMVFQKLKRL